MTYALLQCYCLILTSAVVVTIFEALYMYSQLHAVQVLHTPTQSLLLLFSIIEGNIREIEACRLCSYKKYQTNQNHYILTQWVINSFFLFFLPEGPKFLIVNQVETYKK